MLVDIDTGAEYRVEGSALIGRDASNQIALADPTVSRRHAFLQIADEGRYLLVDLASTSGTFIGRRRIFAKALEDGDVIGLGTARLRFEDRARASKPASTASASSTSTTTSTATSASISPSLDGSRDR